VITILLLVVNVFGASYYISPIAERVRHPLHPIFRSSGWVGQSAGILAFAIFIFLWLYPLRKRWKALAFTGAIGKWLDVHVTAALSLPLLLAIHSAWRSGGVIGLGTDAMLIVCASGVVGRYLYTRIPRAKSGVELTRDEVTEERRAIVAQIAESAKLPVHVVEELLAVASPYVASAGVLAVLRRLVTDDIRRWRMARQIRRRFVQLAGKNSISPKVLKRVVRLASREIALEQHVRMLDATHRVFRYWHVAHRPFAITALIAVGFTWWLWWRSALPGSTEPSGNALHHDRLLCAHGRLHLVAPAPQ
jgi:hypothetical protein